VKVPGNPAGWCQDDRPQVPSRALYLSLAAVSFALAALGAALPLLPTTPFLLITSWCLVRSSPALHGKLRRSAVFGALLRDWEDHRAIALHVKITAVGTVIVTVAASLWFGQLGTTLSIALVVLALAGIAVILRLKTLRSGPPRRLDKSGATGPDRTDHASASVGDR
jgi:uncharacterized protein